MYSRKTQSRFMQSITGLCWDHYQWRTRVPHSATAHTNCLNCCQINDKIDPDPLTRQIPLCIYSELRIEVLNFNINNLKSCYFKERAKVLLLVTQPPSTLSEGSFPKVSMSKLRNAKTEPRTILLCTGHGSNYYCLNMFYDGARLKLCLYARQYCRDLLYSHRAVHCSRCIRLSRPGVAIVTCHNVHNDDHHHVTRGDLKRRSTLRSVITQIHLVESTY